MLYTQKPGSHDGRNVYESSDRIYQNYTHRQDVRWRIYSIINIVSVPSTGAPLQALAHTVHTGAPHPPRCRRGAASCPRVTRHASASLRFTALIKRSTVACSVYTEFDAHCALYRPTLQVFVFGILFHDLIVQCRSNKHIHTHILKRPLAFRHPLRFCLDMFIWRHGCFRHICERKKSAWIIILYHKPLFCCIILEI